MIAPQITAENCRDVPKKTTVARWRIQEWVVFLCLFLFYAYIGSRVVLSSESGIRSELNLIVIGTGISILFSVFGNFYWVWVRRPTIIQPQRNLGSPFFICISLELSLIIAKIVGWLIGGHQLPDLTFAIYMPVYLCIAILIRMANRHEYILFNVDPLEAIPLLEDCLRRVDMLNRRDEFTFKKLNVSGVAQLVFRGVRELPPVPENAIVDCLALKIKGFPNGSYPARWPHAWGRRFYGDMTLLIDIFLVTIFFFGFVPNLFSSS